MAIRKAVTTTKKSQATIAWAWLRTKVIQRCFGPGVRPGRDPLDRYLPTVRGETRISNLSRSSSAILTSPQIGLAVAIARISSRRLAGSLGRPGRLDFQRQNRRNPLRCHRMSLSGFTTTNASRRLNSRLRAAISHRVESSARCGLSLRSWNRANYFRRNRFSAATEVWDRTIRTRKRPIQWSTPRSVRKQWRRLERDRMSADIKAQDRTLQQP
jgi:hypothetical protein